MLPCWVFFFLWDITYDFVISHPIFIVTRQLSIKIRIIKRRYATMPNDIACRFSTTSVTFITTVLLVGVVKLKRTVLQRLWQFMANKWKNGSPRVMIVLQINLGGIIAYLSQAQIINHISLAFGWWYRNIPEFAGHQQLKCVNQWDVQCGNLMFYGMLTGWCWFFLWDIINVKFMIKKSLAWYHNERDGVSNNRRLVCFLNRLFKRRSKKTSKLRVTGLCEGNPPVTFKKGQ